MSYILQIDSSPRQEDSHSKTLADEIVKNLMIKHNDLAIKTRSLNASPLPHISNETIEGFYTPVADMTSKLSEATQLSDMLIKELSLARIVVISAPIYNFSTPSCLKAWIDQIVRINHTFSFDDSGFQGLLPVRDAYLALAYGASGYAPGEAFSEMNFLEPYLISLLGFLGIKNVHVFRVQGTTGDTQSVELERRKVYQALREQIQGGVSND